MHGEGCKAKCEEDIKEVSSFDSVGMVGRNVESGSVHV